MICIYCGDRIDELEDMFFRVGDEAIHSQCADMKEFSSGFDWEALAEYTWND